MWGWGGAGLGAGHESVDVKLRGGKPGRGGVSFARSGRPPRGCDTGVRCTTGGTCRRGLRPVETLCCCTTVPRARTQARDGRGADISQRATGVPPVMDQQSLEGASIAKALTASSKNVSPVVGSDSRSPHPSPLIAHNISHPRGALCAISHALCRNIPPAWPACRPATTSAAFFLSTRHIPPTTCNAHLVSRP